MLNILQDDHWFVKIISAPVEEDVIVPKEVLELESDYYLWENASLLPVTVYGHGFVHSMVMQARTHRQMTFDVQSQRYTHERVVSILNSNTPYEDVWKVFYVKGYKDTPEVYTGYFLEMIKLYKAMVDSGKEPEEARDVLPQGIRQNFVATASLKMWLHFFDLRLKPNAQAEIETFCSLLIEQLKCVYPITMHRYISTRASKGILAP
jgi:thymidylate synthase (FAD)